MASEHIDNADMSNEEAMALAAQSHVPDPDVYQVVEHLKRQNATLLARCEQAEARVTELEAADAANKAAILRDWQFTPSHLQAVRDDATPITSRLRGDYGVRQFPPTALGVVAAERIEQLEATVAACQRAGFVDEKGNVREVKECSYNPLTNSVHMELVLPAEAARGGANADASR